MPDMKMFLGGQELPKPTTFVRTLDPNETDNLTLGGTLYTDFINNRREWQVSWKLMTVEDYQIIHDLYMAQYANEAFHVLDFDAYSITEPVKINISDQNIRFNGNFVENFHITLKEQYAIS